MAEGRKKKGDKATALHATGDEKHSDSDAPMSTKHDATDVGVPMLPGDPSEPQGPEDAFGAGPKRGDYSDRQDPLVHTQTVPIEDAKPGEPNVKAVVQNPRAEDQGKTDGKKGGVTTEKAEESE
jgi:hypothetical protein